MTIKIAHLFPKELNLYGENGNIKALKYGLEEKNIETKIIELNKDDKLDFKTYDLIYIGSGRPEFLEEVKERLIPYKKELLDFIKKDKILLATGNSIYIMELLGLYEVEYYEERIVEDVEATTALCNEKIKGFQNTEYLIKTTDHILFNIEKGYGNADTLLEGYQKGNFYATSIIGPILARNSKLNAYFIETLIDNKES